MNELTPENAQSAQQGMVNQSYTITRFPIEARPDSINNNTESERNRTMSISLPNTATTSQIGQSFDGGENPPRTLFPTISAPGIADLLGGEVEQHQYYYVSKKEAELNAELIRAKAQIRQLESRVETLFHENERLKNELRVLHKSVVGEEGNVNSGNHSRYWSPAEHARFLEALTLFGEDNKKAISTYVGTRTITQIRSHLQKFKLRLEKESTRPALHGERRNNRIEFSLVDQSGGAPLITAEDPALSAELGPDPGINPPPTLIPEQPLSHSDPSKSLQIPPSLESAQSTSLSEKKGIEGVIPIGQQLDATQERTNYEPDYEMMYPSHSNIANNNNYDNNPFE